MASDLKLVIFAACPESDAMPLALQYEVRQIQRMLEGSPFQVIVYTAAQVEDVTRALLHHRPQMVHFCGHGDGGRGLLLQGKGADGRYFSYDGLVGLLARFTEHLQVVVFNTCQSSKAARRLAPYLNTAMGIDGKIDDESAIFFAGILYQAIGRDRSMASAFEIARQALRGTSELGNSVRMFRSPNAPRWPQRPAKTTSTRSTGRGGGIHSSVVVQGGILQAENIVVGSDSKASQHKVVGDAGWETELLDEFRDALRRR